MNIITGEETYTDSTTPIGALIEFYKGFNSQNLEIVQANWSKKASIIMANPIGGLKRSAEIFEGYHHIFSSGAKVYVEYYDFAFFETAEGFSVIGRERGSFENEGVKLDLKIRTTRVYIKEESSYKQVHHHGSIDDADLLKKYQEVILSKENVCN